MNGPQFCYFSSVAVTYGDQPDRHYELASEQRIIDSMHHPYEGDKSYAPCFMPSAYNLHDAREHDAQRARGQFWALAFDVDSGDRELADLQAVLQYALPPCRVHIHATANSGRLDLPKYDGGKRWRVLVMLANPLPGEWYGPVMEATAVYLSEQGEKLSRPVEFDPCTSREGQFMYAPTKGPHHYELSVGQGPGLDLGQVAPVTTLAAHIHAQRAEYELRKLSNASGSIKGGFVGSFNRAHSIEALLTRYGYQARGRRDEWRSPFNSSGSFGTRLFNVGSDDEYFVSKSQSDADQGIGRPAPRGGVMGDAFDLFKFYEHGNDEAKAVAAIKVAMYGAATSGCEVREASTDPETGEFIPAGIYPLALREPGNGWDIWQGMLAAQAAAVQRKLEADRASLAEAKAFAIAAANAEKKRWGGEWLKEVPFHIEKPTALEWAAWHAPGLLGEIVRCKAQQASRHTLVPILAGALAALCRLGQGKFVSKYKKYVTPTALMIYLVGDTGAGKGDATDTFYDIMRLVKPEFKLNICSHVKQHFASSEALVQYMAEVSPHVLLIQEEAGATRSANRGDSRQEAVSAGITNVFTAFKNGMAAGHAKTQGASTKEIHNPSFAALLLSTPAKLFKTIEGGDAESGWLGRYMFMDIGGTSPKFKDAAMEITYPRSVVEGINRLAYIAPPQAAHDDPRIYNGEEYSFHVLYYTAEASSYMDRVEDFYDERSRDLRYPAIERALHSRGHESVNRLATVVGVGVNPERPIDLKTAEWADLVTRASVATVSANMANTYDGDQDDSPVARIRRGIAQYFEKAEADEAFARGFGRDIRKGVDGHTELARSTLKNRLFHNKLKAVKISSKQVNEEIDEMIRDGLMVDLGKDGNGRSWLRFVKW